MGLYAARDPPRFSLAFVVSRIWRRRIRRGGAVCPALRYSCGLTFSPGHSELLPLSSEVSKWQLLTRSPRVLSECGTFVATQTTTKTLLEQCLFGSSCPIDSLRLRPGHRELLMSTRHERDSRSRQSMPYKSDEHRRRARLVTSSIIGHAAALSATKLASVHQSMLYCSGAHRSAGAARLGVRR